MHVVSRRIARPIISVLAVLAAMGLGLMTEAHTASAGQPDTDTSMGSQSRGGGAELQL